MNTQWISILKCPISGQNLSFLDAAAIDSLNRRVDNQELWQADGKSYKSKITAGLISDDQMYIYPIIKGIIILLKDLALVDAKNKLATNNTLSADKQLVKDFYDEKGWFANEEGNYEDGVIFEDFREVSKKYINRCHDRVNRHLNPSGTYLLDAASGALQFDHYLQYSANYKYRVCVDFSFQALSEVKKKLGDKAICVLCDMTNMPFKNDCIDGFISLNTIYHIPKDEQVTAIKELYRVLMPKGKGVIVYEWFKHSAWMNFWLFVPRVGMFAKNRLNRVASKIRGSRPPGKLLYFHAFPYQYFKANLPFDFRVAVWRSVSVPFLKIYIHKNFMGEKILDWLYAKEEKEPENCGRKGEYPMFLIEKN
jgi:SAM-dependent methyltransferase